MDVVKNYICLDIETTGIGANCEIIEVAAVRVRDGEIVDTMQELIKPTTEIPQSITWLTGITNEDVQNARTADKVISDFLIFIGDDILVGHNIRGFDYNYIARDALEYTGLIMENCCIDTLDLSREIPLKSHSLAQMCDYYGIVNEAAHRALSDVIATNKLFQKLMLGERNENYEERNVPEKKLSYYSISYNKQTLALRELTELLKKVMADGIVEENEVYEIREWLDNNQELKGNFPFDYIDEEVNAALADGILEPHELDRLCKVFLYAIDPISNKEPCKDAEPQERPIIKGSNICLTGDFLNGSRSEIERILTENGAVCCKSVTRKLDYLVVGSFGSGAWAEGNYGTKIKKVLEYQKKNIPITIITEIALFNVLEEEKCQSK